MCYTIAQTNYMTVVSYQCKTRIERSDLKVQKYSTFTSQDFNVHGDMLVPTCRYQLDFSGCKWPIEMMSYHGISIGVCLERLVKTRTERIITFRQITLL